MSPLSTPNAIIRGNNRYSSSFGSWAPSSSTASGMISAASACHPFIGVSVNGRQTSPRLARLSISLTIPRPGKLCQIEGGKGTMCRIHSSAVAENPTNNQRRRVRCSRFMVSNAIAHITTETGRRTMSDWTSTRDAPPVKNTMTRNIAKHQNWKEGGLRAVEDEGKYRDFSLAGH
jgi:hypothetical protein